MMMLFLNIEIYYGFCDMWLLSWASWLGWELANNDNIYLNILLQEILLGLKKMCQNHLNYFCLKNKREKEFGG